MKPSRPRLVPPTSVLHAVAIYRISLRVSEIDRSRGFYEGLLGMIAVAEGAGSVDLAFGTPARTLRLRQLEGGAETAYVDELAFAVEEPPETISTRLQEFGVEAGPGSEGGWVVADPVVFPLTLVPASRNGPSVRASSDGLFSATAVNHAAMQVPDYGEARDFLTDLLGLRLTFEDGKRCAIACGAPPDSVYLNPLKQPRSAFVDHFAISVDSFDLADAQQRLNGAGLPTQPDGAYAWTTLDPDGFRVQVCSEIGVYPGAATDPFHEP